jgi:hypothetical protein
MTVAIICLGITKVNSQITIPEVLLKGSVSDQMNYIEANTRIYENYRAIREDMFQLIKKNSIDSLTICKNKITAYIGVTASLENQIDSLKRNLIASKEEGKEFFRTKNSIHVLGIDLNKTAYNSVMWMIVSGLLAFLVIGFLVFKRNLAVTIYAKKELNELKTEFEVYRQKTRIEKEKVSMDHFNEIRKLKGK